MKTKATILVMLAFTALALPCVAIDDVWNLAIPKLRIQGEIAFPVAALQIEEQSKTVDPSGRGVRIVYPKEPEAGHMIRARLSGEDLSISDAVRFVAKIAGYSVRFVGDVALCVRRQDLGQPLLQTGVLRGRITDSEGHPITNATFATDSLMNMTNQIWTTKNGSYVAAVTYVTRRPHLGLTLYEKGDDTVTLIVAAPGYETQSVTADLSDAVQIPCMDIKLKRIGDSNKTPGHIP